jgi:hypothetical protein
MIENWQFTLFSLVLLGIMTGIGYLDRLLLPKPEEGTMKIDEALKMMDEAVADGHLYGAPSEVYPGLNAVQALRFVLEGFLASFPADTEARDTMRVHPRVEIRIRQVCVNKVRSGEPPADASIAAIFFMAHPEDKPEAPFKVPVSVHMPQPEIKMPEVEEPNEVGKRKFL